jgi:hypothetical protein
MFETMMEAAVDGVTDLDLELGVDLRWGRHLSQAQRTALDRTQLETLPPGDRLGRLLTTIDPAGLDMHDLVSYLGACERQTAWAQARQLVAVRELAGRRLVPGPHGEPADTALRRLPKTDALVAYPTTGHYPPNRYPTDQPPVGQPAAAPRSPAFGVRDDGWLATHPTARPVLTDGGAPPA